MSEIRVGVFGASGRMGSQVVHAVDKAEGMTIVGGVDIGEPRETVGPAQVIVDFTHPDAVMDNIEWAVSHGINMVIGTTGFTPERIARVRELVEAHPKVGVLIASNFGIGAILMMRFAEIAAKFYPSVEIIELHHPNKVDAPSGTAATTARRIAAARDEAGLGPVPDATVHDDGARGAVIDGIHVHGVRLQGLVAHQEVLFGQAGETLTIREDSYDRVSFMPGVVAGIRHIVAHPGLTLEMDDVLNF
ncbi:4-hydroxy-tetrahydrodipicolinate reductase [Tessaracoccus palaemonis]|uniref:4-hydroxy-tetrahydrodipicolinate reductase n=1 Tax=Tessaracoccus palaemonis TaxID=2829499 RepID=A0ABX8SGU1_9ACTN|nr:4-hydroxy-tetrahydrodipicolinate reductase [Tessaracoccus palaemonis]QXT61900.1 4-hydroxy-tetrahydrodipicolinate reductase [Tessaracoccus palaemonis]